MAKEEEQLMELTHKERNVKKYEEMLKLNPWDTILFKGEQVDRSFIANKLKKAERKVAILKEKLGSRLPKEL